MFCKLCPLDLLRFNRTSRNPRTSSHWRQWSAWTSRFPRRERSEGRAWCSRAFFARSPRTFRSSWFTGSTRATWTSRLFQWRTKLRPWRAWTSRCAGRERIPWRIRPERWENIQTLLVHHHIDKTSTGVNDLMLFQVRRVTPVWTALVAPVASQDPQDLQDRLDSQVTLLTFATM